MRLLLVEDDPMIGETVLDLLRAEHYAVDWVRDGDMADTALRDHAYDLVVLDLGLPRRDGLSVLRTLRARLDRTPVLIATARDAKPDRIAGLDAGADDYVLKPYDLDELLARIRALLRRRVSRSRSVIEHGALILDLASHDVTFEGELIKLPPREFSVLRALLDHPGKVVSKRQLSEKLYGWDSEVESNTVDVYVYQLRKKFGADCIQTVRGVGYKMREASC